MFYNKCFELISKSLKKFKDNLKIIQLIIGKMQNLFGYIVFSKIKTNI